MTSKEKFERLIKLAGVDVTKLKWEILSVSLLHAKQVLGWTEHLIRILEKEQERRDQVPGE